MSVLSDRLSLGSSAMRPPRCYLRLALLTEASVVYVAPARLAKRQVRIKPRSPTQVNETVLAGIAQDFFLVVAQLTSPLCPRKAGKLFRSNSHGQPFV